MLMRHVATILLVTFSTVGCARLEPWLLPHERGNLADPIMSQDRHPASSEYMLHVYDAREAARGGDGAGGGGCGCN